MAEEAPFAFLEKIFGEESVISNDYSIEDGTVILTVTRCIREFDIGKSLVAKCRFKVDYIKRAIEFFPNNRDCIYR